jgi:hypothetical protein
MADITTLAPISGRLQALCLARPIKVWTDDDAASGRAYTQQDPRPGLPVAKTPGQAVVVPSGSTTGTADYEVRCQHGGLPGQVDHGMTAAVRREGEPLWLGSEQPGVISGHEPIDAAITATRPHIVAHPDGTLIAVVNIGAAGYVYTKAPADTAWTSRGRVTDITSTPNTKVYYPCLLVVEKAVYLLAWRQGLAYDPATATKPNTFISAWVSTDSGATWALAQDYCTTEEDSFDDVVVPGDPASGAGTLFTCGRIRAAYRDGEVVVFAHMKGYRLNDDMDVIRQYAGPALTQRLDVVETYPPAPFTLGRQGRALPDVVATPAGFVVAWLENGLNSPQVVTIGSAWQPLSTAQVYSIAGPYGIDADGGFASVGTGTAQVLDDDDVGEMALAYDPAGVLWCYTCSGGTGLAIGSGVQYAYYSTDGGQKWTPGHATIPAVTDISGYWFYPDDLAAGAQGNRPTAIAATWWRGQVALVHGSEGTTAGSGGLSMTYMGGWTDLALPYERHGVKIGHRQGWLRTWLPFELPDNQLYTRSTAGVFSSILSTGAHAVTSGNGAGSPGLNWYRMTGVDNGVRQIGDGEVDMSVSATEGTGTTFDIGFRMRLASTTHGVEWGCVRTPTGIYIRDVVAGTALASVTGLTSGARYAIRWGLEMVSDTGAGRALQVWYRLSNGGAGHEKRRWTRIGSWTLADDSGAGGVVPHMDWGHIISSGATTQNASRWYRVLWAFPYSASGPSPGSHAIWPDLDQSGGDNPDILPGRPLGSALDYALDGMTIAGRRGPGLIGDRWTIPVSGGHEVERAISLDTPSPRIHHRSVDTSSDVVIPWAVDADRPLVEDTEHPPAMALHIVCNWRLATLQYRTVAGAWTTAATIDTRVLQGVSFTRTGKTIRASATGSTVYLHRDEVGPAWTVEWDDGAGATVYRHPSGNAPGRWSSATTEPRARIELGSTKVGDPTTGGTLSLWSPEVTVIVPGVTASAWRLVIDSTHGTADGDYRTKFQWCEAHPLAMLPSWGRGLTAIAGHDRAEMEGGVGVRVDRAPASKALRIAWDEGIDETERHSGGDTQHVTPWSSGSEPASIVGEVPSSVVSMIDRQSGRPVGWVVWARVASAAVVIRRAFEQHWGTAESAPDTESTVGDEALDEVVRIATLTIRRET